jgi:TetR/AcrR family transcriptional regulator, tetracycline repressor protein
MTVTDSDGDDDPTDGTSGGRSRTWRYGELTQDDVVDAALRLTLRDGLAGLSMRKLATELGISSMNAYYHVRNKRALLDLVGDAVLGQVPAPPDDEAWDDQLVAVFESGRRVLLRYPGVAEHLLVRSEGHANEARLYRMLSRILIGAGFDRGTNDRAQRVLAYLLFGAVTSEMATATAGEDAAPMRFADDDEVFRYGLDLVLEGLRAQHRAARTG